MSFSTPGSSNSASTPRQLLFEEFQRRRAKNPRYSLRAFALYLGLTPGRLSQYISGKRNITPQALRRICDRLEVSPASEASMLARTFRKSKVPPAADLRDEDYFMLDDRALQSDDSLWRVIAEWEHFAILNLIRIKGQKHDPASLACRLGITAARAQEAIARMIALGLLVRNRSRLVRTREKITTPDGISSRALRKVHRDVLEQAIECLERTPVELRSITSTIMPVCTRRLPEAMERIKVFRRALNDFLECEDADEVYNLNIQLVPVTRVVSENEK